MTRIIADISVSLDGFVTGPDPGPDNGLGTGGEALHTWAFSDDPDDRRVLGEGTARSGAVVLGRRLFDVVDGPNGWDDTRGYGAGEVAKPAFVVVTSSPPESVRTTDLDWTFVTTGLHDAVAAARERAEAASSAGGKDLDDAEALERTHWPESVANPPSAPAGRTGFYGLGWNVSYDDGGRLRLSHTGAFAQGAHTNVTMLPGERLGIVVLTNTAPVGVADAVALDFFDIAQTGEISRDWIPIVDALYQQEADEGRSKTDYARPPADVTPAKAADTYTGTYGNDYYEQAEVVAGPDGTLTLRLGPEPQSYPLTHYDADTFSFETAGGNAVGRTGVTFTPDHKSFTVEYLNTQGLGTFTRSGPSR
nr:serine hydrolase [Streptomyces purpureus]